MDIDRTLAAGTQQILLADIDDGIHTPQDSPGNPPPKYGESRQTVPVPAYGTTLEVIDTDRVLLSDDRGNIKDFVDAGLITATP